MLTRLIAWIRSWFTRDGSLSEDIRLDHLGLKKSQGTIPAQKKPVKYRETKCICGCGQTAMTAQGTLRYFITREHRFNYRRIHGSGYGRYQTA